MIKTYYVGRKLLHERHRVGTIVNQRSDDSNPELIWCDVGTYWGVEVVAKGEAIPHDGKELPKNIIPCHHDLLPLVSCCFNRD